MNRILFLLPLLLLTRTFLYGQLSATASVSADIIYPIGTEIKGDLISGIFYPSKKTGTVELNNNGIHVKNGFEVKSQHYGFETPDFQLSGNQYIYSITLTYDPLLINNNSGRDTMIVESLMILKENEIEANQNYKEKFSIETRLRVGASQVPGVYYSPSPCNVIFHFN